MMDAAQVYFEMLLRTQFLPPERLMAYQASLVEPLVRHAREHVPFYRDTGRLDALFTADDKIDWSRWEQIPILTRVEAQKHTEALYSEFVPENCGRVMTGYTTGSTGTPLRYRASSNLADVGTAMLERALVWARLPARLSLAWFMNDRQHELAYPDGKTYQSVIRGEPRLIHFLAVQTSIEDQGRWLARRRPDVVIGYPGAMALLADNLPDELKDHRFQLAICVGEVTTEQTRSMIAQGFGCRVMDLYSGSEFGSVAAEDCDCRCLFISEESLFVELNRREEVASAGEQPVELIFTPFYNYAMPLIRYATGDFAVVDTRPPPDGRTLRRLKRIAGRERNFFILPSGRLWWPTYQSGVIATLLDYKQMQFAQTATDRIEIRFASDRAEPIKDVEKLHAYLRRVTPEPMEIVLKRVAAIAQRPSGKYEYATCEIAKPF
jgi:phenylacetate-coenzyme A ligase PaaK-like adenylate-forming protein